MAPIFRAHVHAATGFMLLVLAGCGDDGTTTTGGAATTTSATIASSSSAGGSGGSGGSGGAPVCTAGAEEPCYTGPAATQGIGACKAGIRTCLADGSGFGSCVGEIVPASETCSGPSDEDCDGLTNEEGADCVCAPGSTTACYEGDPATLDVGVCHGGTATCNADGLGYGPCVGEVLPGIETCTDPTDEDCDGLTNEEGPDCVCTPGSVASCYSAPPATMNVGICKAGLQTCKPDGLGYGVCMGEIDPAPETCNTPADDDCDGQVNEGGPGCLCPPNEMVACYTGPAGTLNIGTCAAGLATCNMQGTALGPCIGQVLPATENCTTPADEDCDGLTPPCQTGLIYAKLFGDSAYQEGLGIAIDPTGAVAVTGDFHGSINFGGSSYTAVTGSNAFLVKLGPSGNQLWSKGFGDFNTTIGRAVAFDASGGVAFTGNAAGTVDFGAGPTTGNSSDSFFIARYDAGGNHLWSHRVTPTSGNATGYGVAIDSTGAVWVTGSLLGTMNLGGAPLVAPSVSSFAVKYDAGGNHVSSKVFGNGTAFAIAVDPNGNVAIAGEMSGTVDFGGGPLNSGGATDAFVVELNASGQHLWSKRFGGAMDQATHGVAIDASGRVAIAGPLLGSADFGGGSLTSVAGSYDIFAAMFDGSGNHLWSKRFGDAGAQIGYAIGIDALGNSVITGGIAGTTDFGGGPLTSAGNYDVFAARFDAAGTSTYSARFGNSAMQLGQSIATSNGKIAFTGSVAGSADFGAGALTAAGTDVFVTVIAP